MALRKTTTGPWINGANLSCVYVMRRIQPLQQRDHPMWEYAGPTDSTRTKADELSRDEFDSRIRAILNLSGEDTPVLAVVPLSSDNPPTEVISKNFLFYLFLSSYISLLLYTSFSTESRLCSMLSSSL